MPEVLRIEPARPDGALMARALAILKGGGVLAYPTETFYGLGVDGLCDKAVERLFHSKGRDFNKPVGVIIGAEGDLDSLVAEIPPGARRLMGRFWPGPLTLVFQAGPAIPVRLTAGTGKIGIRVSSHPLALSLAGQLGGPITATSANRSGQPECTTAAEVIAQLGGDIDAVLDGGPTAGGKGSTFVDLTVVPPLILREGAVPKAAIRECLAG